MENNKKMSDIIRFDDNDNNQIIEIVDNVTAVSTINQINLTLFKAKKMILKYLQSEIKINENKPIVVDLFKLYNDICFSDLIITDNKKINIYFPSIISIEISILNVKIKTLIQEIKNFIISDLFCKFINDKEIITNKLILFMINKLIQNDIYINFNKESNNKYVNIYHNINIDIDNDISEYTI